MKEHTISWYEATDGKLFENEMEAYDHELNVLYKMSGVIFYIGGNKVDRIETSDEKTYNEITDIYIDRSKAKENEAFYKFLNENYGWNDIEEALEGMGTHYRFGNSPFDSIQEVE